MAAKFRSASFMFDQFVVYFRAKGREVAVIRSRPSHHGRPKRDEVVLDNSDRIYKPCVKHCLLAYERAFPTAPGKRTTPNIYDNPVRFVLKLVK